jgi:hypothetical protein
VIIAKAVSQIKTNGADIGESPISINALYRQPKWRNPKRKALTGSQEVPRKWQVQVRWAQSLGKERTGELVSKFGTPNQGDLCIRTTVYVGAEIRLRTHDPDEASHRGELYQAQSSRAGGSSQVASQSG